MAQSLWLTFLSISVGASLGAILRRFFLGQSTRFPFALSSFNLHRPCLLQLDRPLHFEHLLYPTFYANNSFTLYMVVRAARA